MGLGNFICCGMKHIIELIVYHKEKINSLNNIFILEDFDDQ